ncbi:hypothetical protein ACFL23_02580 [Patescibacteria group bacterium]
MIFLKITKNKVKLLLFYFFISLLLSVPFAFLIAYINRTIGFEHYEKIKIIIYSLNILNLFIISYFVLAFLKKKLFFKKYFIELIKVFLIFFIAKKIHTLFLTLLYKTVRSEIYFSNAMQITGFILQVIIYYIAVCFVFKFCYKK